MANILCVWELGSNLGHLTNLKPFIDSALANGHSVTLAARELQNVRTVIDSTEVRIFQAPYLRKKQRKVLLPIISYPQLVLRQVFGSEQELEGLYLAWNSIFDSVEPDLVIYDHSPTALVASLGKGWTKWVVGSGFMIPRGDHKFFGVFPDTPQTPENDQRLADTEKSLLNIINSVLGKQDGHEIECFEACFKQCEEQLFLTIPELDHYGAREKGCYLGVKHLAAGVAPSWPESSAYRAGPKIFLYLDDTIGVSVLLGQLLKYGSRLLVYGRELSPELLKKYQDAVHFSSVPIDLQAVWKQADYFINHGNHGSALQAFVAGVPQLMIPTHQEQLMFAKRIEMNGRGFIARLDQKDFTASIEKLFSLRRKVVRLKQSGLESKDGIDQKIESLFKKYQL